MPAEPRDAGRWRRDEPSLDGNIPVKFPGGSSPKGLHAAAGEAPRPMVLGRTEGLDGRMLTALEQGVKGGKWFSLIDKVIPSANPGAAFCEVSPPTKELPGWTTSRFRCYEARLDANCGDSSEDLGAGPTARKPSAGTTSPNREVKELRPLGIPTVQRSSGSNGLRMALEPIFERDFAAAQLWLSPRYRGVKTHSGRVDELLKTGYTHIVDADLKSYFDTIPTRPPDGPGWSPRWRTDGC